MKLAFRELMIVMAIVGVLVLIFHGATINAGFEFQRTNLRDLIFGFERVGD